MEYLRELGGVPPEPVTVPTPAEALLDQYRENLISERGLKRSTASGYMYMLLPFMRRREASDGSVELTSLTSADTTSEAGYDQTIGTASTPTSSAIHPPRTPATS